MGPAAHHGPQHLLREGAWSQKATPAWTRTGVLLAQGCAIPEWPVLPSQALCRATARGDIPPTPRDSSCCFWGSPHQQRAALQ